MKHGICARKQLKLSTGFIRKVHWSNVLVSTCRLMVLKFVQSLKHIPKWKLVQVHRRVQKSHPDESFLGIKITAWNL